MGCDIHLRLERKAKGQSKWQGCRIFGYERCWNDRIYGMFAALADVRNYNDIEHLPVRGMPKDAADRTLKLYGYQVAVVVKYPDWQYSEEDAERFVKEGYSEYYDVNGVKYVSCPDWHTPSWCTTAEMEDCINRIFKNADGGYIGDYSEWLALLGAMKGYEAGGSECRAVFWFDN